MAWLEMRYISPATGKAAAHTAYITNASHFLDILDRYLIGAEHITELRVNGQNQIPEQLIKTSRRAING